MCALVVSTYRIHWMRLKPLSYHGKRALKIIKHLHEIMESWLKNQQMDARYSLTFTELCQIGFSKSKRCVVCTLKNS